MPSPSTWFAASRPKTLPAAISPVLVGTAIAWEDGLMHLVSAILCCVSAVFIQIGTNYHNDAADFEKGSDTRDRRGPVRATAAGLVSPGAMKRAAALAFGAAVLSGAYLMLRGGWPIVLIGVLSIVFGILYTAGPRSLSALGVADVFVFIFFGPVAVAGTYYVQALDVSLPAILAGFATGALSVAILLVNNIRDVEEDGRSGKRTLVVRLGREWGVRLYAICIAVASAVPVVLLLLRPSNLFVLSALLVIPLAVFVWTRLRVERRGWVLNTMLARTAQVLLVYSVLLSIGWAV